MSRVDLDLDLAGNYDLSGMLGGLHNSHPVHLEVRNELHGWRKLWARLRRRPWAWVFEADVIANQARETDDGLIAVDFTPVTPLVKREVM